MKRLATRVVACLVLLVTASAAFSQQCPYRAGSPPNWCGRGDDGGHRYYPTPGTPADPSNPASRHHYGVPRAPEDPYSTPSIGGREPPTYAIPTVPTNPYTPPPNRTQLPVASSYPSPMPFPPANPYDTSGGAFSYKCVVSNVGDFCIGASTAPASPGAGCVCGGRYNGYVE
jgi:hypothetical protein